MTLKQTIATFFSALLISMVMLMNVCGQVKVSGHITSKVIESGPVSTAMLTSFRLKNEKPNTGLLQQNKSYRNTDILILVAVTINAGMDVSVA